MNPANEPITMGFIRALEQEGELVTAKALSEAFSDPDSVTITVMEASKVLKRLCKEGYIKKLGGDPVVYESI